MQLYARSSTQFIEDAIQNRLTGKLTESFFKAFRHQPTQSEVRSWRESLSRMSRLLQYGHFTDHGIVLVGDS